MPDDISPENRRRFRELFAGLDRAYGKYELDPTNIANDRGKRKGEGVTMRSDLLPEMYDAHLNGHDMLGVIPIQDGNRCQFGAIDIDDYKLDVPALLSLVKENKLPVVPTRSKSGGVHLYVFSSLPLPADPIVDKLEEIGAKLGFPGVEVFPKQRTISATGVGNWINLPWFDARNTDRFGWNVETGEEIHSFEEWLDYAESRMLTLEDISRVQVRQPANGDGGNNRLISNGPPCLQKITERGVGDGERNTTAFNVVVYLRNKHGDDEAAMWQELHHIVRESFTPPLGDDELQTIVNNVERNAETLRYQCNVPPLVSNCNRAMCVRRKYGIGLSGTEHDYGELWHIIPQSLRGKKLWDDSSWRLLFTVDTVEFELELKTEELMKHSSVRMYAARRGIWIPALDAEEWANIVQEKMQRAQQVIVPEEVTTVGALRALLVQFFDIYAHGTEKKQLASGQAWHNVEHREYWTPRTLLANYLKTERFPLTGTRLNRALEEHFGMKPERRRIIPGKESLRLWVFPDNLTEDTGSEPDVEE